MSEPLSPKLLKINSAIDRFNDTPSNGARRARRRFSNPTTFCTERVVEVESRVLTLGKFVNLKQDVHVPVVLRWEFGPGGQLTGVNLWESEPQALRVLELRS